MPRLILVASISVLGSIAALSAVLATITRLFPAVPKHLVRDLASAVLRDLAGRGIVLATRQGDRG